MKWGEFSSLLAGLSEDTPLGKIVRIRSETNKEVIKHFTPHQRKIRSDWLARKSQNISLQDANQAVEEYRRLFLAWAGDKHGR